MKRHARELTAEAVNSDGMTDAALLTLVILRVERVAASCYDVDDRIIRRAGEGIARGCITIDGILDEVEGASAIVCAGCGRREDGSSQTGLAGGRDRRSPYRFGRRSRD